MSMTIRIPDTITSEHSEKYIVSIRLAPDGFSFSGYNPQEADSAFFCHRQLSKPDLYIDSLKEFFFTNECLSWKYKKIYVVHSSSDFQVLPKEMFDEKMKEQLMQFVFCDSKGHVFSNKLKFENVVLLSTIPEDIYEFCSRSFINPLFLNLVSVLLTQWQKQASNSLYRQMYISLSKDKMTFAAFAPQGKLLFANNISYRDNQDLLYYILYIWKQNKFNQLQDCLYIYGETGKCEDLRKSLSAYVRNVSQLYLPSEVYLRGNDLLEAPLDLIYLTVCEL